MTKKLIALLCALVICIGAVGCNSSRQARVSRETRTPPDSEIYIKIVQAYEAIREVISLSEQDDLLAQVDKLPPGSSISDWYAVVLGRAGIPEDYSGYLAALEEYITDCYSREEKLDRIKSTEWQRISLAVTALGGDPTAIGANSEINLIADGTYGWTHTNDLGKQGLNGYIFALIAVDSMSYEVPADAAYTREDIIAHILSAQEPGGGFGLSRSTGPDIDITAMALQALSPYYNSNTVYELSDALSGRTSATVGECVEAALEYLSQNQEVSGDFKSWGDPNLESAAQVTIALCSLGIDPRTDGRFTKQGNSLYDVMMCFWDTSGGFKHLQSDTQLDAMANEQGMLALIALYRLEKGLGRLYDFTVPTLPDGDGN